MKADFWGSSARVPDSVDLRWGLRKCISNMLLLQALKRESSPLPRGLDHTLLSSGHLAEFLDLRWLDASFSCNACFSWKGGLGNEDPL